VAIPTTHFSFADLLDKNSALYQLDPPARLALLGTSVAHSRSPQIHNRLLVELADASEVQGFSGAQTRNVHEVLEDASTGVTQQSTAAVELCKKSNERLHQLNLPWQYVTIDVKAEELSQALELLRRSKFLGFNLTMPHKQEGLKLVDEVTDHARLLGAINTVVIRDGQFFGSNTDGPGFVAALHEEWNFSLKDRSLLILGATGGTGRALAMQAALEGCCQLFLASRTPIVLQEQVKALSQIKPGLFVKTITLDELSLCDAMLSVDLIVNATPVGFSEQDIPSLIPTTFFQPRHYAYDIVYSTKPTPLIQAAHQAGAHSADGSSMLRLQGALSFQTWF
jgi:shikimate dehydrogenase